VKIWHNSSNADNVYTLTTFCIKCIQIWTQTTFCYLFAEENTTAKLNVRVFRLDLFNAIKVDGISTSTKASHVKVFRLLALNQTDTKA